MSDAVSAFRQISWLIFKWILWAVLALIVLAALIGSGAYAYNWYNYDRHFQNVKFDLSTDRPECKDSKFPLSVVVYNGSGRTIEKISFTFEARLKGRSTDIAKYHSYDDDHIIPPNKGYGICWAVPELTEKVADIRTLDWSLKYKTVNFAN